MYIRCDCKYYCKMIDIPGNPYKMFGIPELHTSKKYKAVPYALYSKKTCTRMCSFLDSLLLSVLLTLQKNIIFLFSFPTACIFLL